MDIKGSTMTESLKPRLFVTGAGGHLGRRVVELLLESGATVIAGSRNPENLADLAVRGAEIRRADFDDPSSLEQAFTGVDRLLVISVLDTPHDPPLRLRQHKAAVEAAAKAGVGSIVYTSMQKPEPDSPIPFAGDHYGTEQAIRDTGLPFTILRPNWYTDIAFMWAPQALASKKLTSAAGDGRVAYMWRDDLAHAAAAALLEGGSESRVLNVSGPEALTPQEITDTLNDVFGSQVELAQVSDEDLREGLESAGLPPGMVEVFTAFEVNTRMGRVDTVCDDFKTLTGREPRSLREYLIENRAALWDMAQAIGN